MKIQINMSIARDVHRAKIREARAPKLAELDTTFQRELEKPDPDTSAVAELKQQLRDLPASLAIAAATTPEALKASWPAELLGASPYSEG